MMKCWRTWCVFHCYSQCKDQSNTLWDSYCKDDPQSDSL